jgi:hypothetical protein
MNDVLTNKGFFCNTGYQEIAIISENNDVINIGTITDKFIFLKSVTDKAIRFIRI